RTDRVRGPAFTLEQQVNAISHVEKSPAPGAPDGDVRWSVLLRSRSLILTRIRRACHIRPDFDSSGPARRTGTAIRHELRRIQHVRPFPPVTRIRLFCPASTDRLPFTQVGL